STATTVYRFALPAGRLKPVGEPSVIVKDLPGGGHNARNLALSGDGKALFVNVGSPSNVCQVADRSNESPGKDPCPELATRAGIWRFDATKQDQTEESGTHYATGIRNAVGMVIAPDGQLWSTQHGRDQLFQNWPKLFTAEQSAEKPSEELLRVNQGDDFGWPYCYHDAELGHLVLAPEYGGDGKEVGRCAQKKEPAMAFPGHWAPDGLMFYTGSQFPAAYSGGAFIAILNAPRAYERTLGRLPQQVSRRPAATGLLDFVQFFTREKGELEREFAALARALTPAGMLWISWPKQSSGVATDLTEDVVRA